MTVALAELLNRQGDGRRVLAGGLGRGRCHRGGYHGRGRGGNRRNGRDFHDTHTGLLARDELGGDKHRGILGSEHFHPFALGGTREDELGAAGHFGEDGELLAGTAANIEVVGAHGGDVELHRLTGGIHAVQDVSGLQEIGVHPQAGIGGHLHAVPFAGFPCLGRSNVDLFENVDWLIFVKLKHK